MGRTHPHKNNLCLDTLPTATTIKLLPTNTWHTCSLYPWLYVRRGAHAYVCVYRFGWPGYALWLQYYQTWIKTSLLYNSLVLFQGWHPFSLVDTVTACTILPCGQSLLPRWQPSWLISFSWWWSCKSSWLTSFLVVIIRVRRRNQPEAS